MRILRLHPENPNDYCCNVYWVVGDSACIGNPNTLVDVGSSHSGNLAALLKIMADFPKGVGRPAVEQVILTHVHYDHVGGLPAVVSHFHPKVYAHVPVSRDCLPLVDGGWLRIGDKDFRVVHTPGHSDDSVCLFCPETRDLFTGDTLYRISDTCGSYPICYLRSLERIKALGATTLYPGHGEPIRSDVDSFIDEVLANVQASTLRH